MLLVMDIGNTNTVLGVYEGERLLNDWRITTQPHQLRTVAQNVVLEVATNGFDITRVHRRPLPQPVQSRTFDLGDFRDGDRGVLVLDLIPHEFARGAVASVDCTLSLDRTDLAKREWGTLHLEAVMTDSEPLVRRNVDPGVLLYADIIDAIERAEDAVLGLDSEGLRQATELFDQHYDRVRRHAIDARDQQLLNQTYLLKHFMDELAEANESGVMHDHDEARDQLIKEVDYRRYLREHHRRLH